MKKRNMALQLGLAVIPIVNLIGFYRIKKLGLAIVLNIIINVISYGFAFIGIALFGAPIVLPIPFPWYLFVVSPVYLYFMYRWTKQYNEK